MEESSSGNPWPNIGQQREQYWRGFLFDDLGTMRCPWCWSALSSPVMCDVCDWGQYENYGQQWLDAQNADTTDSGVSDNDNGDIFDPWLDDTPSSD